MSLFPPAASSCPRSEHALTNPVRRSEYSLPTPESITNPFGTPFAHHAHHAAHAGLAHHHAHSAHAQHLGISPSDVSPLKTHASSSSLKEPPSPASLHIPNGVGPAAGNGAAGGGAASKNEKQALLANEKRRRRRESHNAVERRRRDNINEKISELATLIPECMLDPSGEWFSFPFLFSFFLGVCDLWVVVVFGTPPPRGGGLRAPHPRVYFGSGFPFHSP